MAVVACDDGSDSAPSPTPLPTATPTPLPTPTPTPIPTPTPLPTATLAPGEPTPTSVPGAVAEGTAGVLQAAFDAVAAEPSFHFDMSAELSVDAEGTSLDIPLTLSGDFLAPDRFQGTMELKIFFFTIETEIVTIGDTTWTKDPETGEWSVSTGGDPTEVIPSDPGAFTELDIQLIKGLTSLGEVELNGAPATHLRGTAPEGSFGQDTGEFEVDFWIDSGTGLLVQLVASGELTVEAGDDPGGQSEGIFGAAAGQTGRLSLAVGFSDFGKPVTIEPPIGP